jgi:hypothetical protein
MTSAINNYNQRLFRAYKQLEKCRLVANRLITEATCAEFDAICNGCAPVDREEFIVVHTIRSMTRASMTAFETPGMEHYAVVVGGLPLLNNLRISDIAHLPFSTDEVFCRITAYRVFSNRDPRPAPKQRREQFDGPLQRKEQFDGPLQRKEPEDAVSTRPKYDGFRSTKQYVPRSADSRSADSRYADTRESKYDARKPMKIIPRPGRERNAEFPPWPNKEEIDARRELRKTAEAPKKKPKKPADVTEADLAADLVAEKPVKQVPKPAAKKVPAQPRKKMPAMMLDDFLDLKNEIAEDIKRPVEKEEENKEGKKDEREEKNKEENKEKNKEENKDLSKSWADMAEEDTQ